jgi:hypothetical protein
MNYNNITNESRQSINWLNSLPRQTSNKQFAFDLHSRFLPNLDHYIPNPNHLNFIHHNAQSLLPKIDHYNSINVQQYDIISISETWLNPKLPDSLASIEEFQIHRSDRTDKSKGRGGGSALYIKKSINHIKLHSLSPLSESEFDIVWVQTTFNHSANLIVGSVYLPPNINTHNFFHYLKTTLDEPIFNKANILLLGDFNCNWLKTSTLKSNLEDICEQYNLDMPIQGPTYISNKYGNESLIDFSFISKQLSIYKPLVLVTQLSDHYAITGGIKINCKRTPRKLITVRNYTKYLPLLKEIDQVPNFKLIDEIKLNKDPNVQVNILEGWVDSLIQKLIPLKSIRIRPDRPPWLNSDLKKLISQKNRFYRKVMNAKTFSNSHWICYKKFRNHVHIQIKQAKKNYIANQLSKSPHTFYKEINNLLGRKSLKQTSPDTLISSTNKSLTNPLEIATELNHFFTTIESPNPTINAFNCKVQSPIFNFKQIKIDEVHTIISRLKPKKCGGLDKIPSSVYQALTNTISPALTSIINNCIETTIFPDIYKKALVTPIHKKGNKSHSSNYRPISSLPILSKVIEKILNSQVVNHITQHNLLSPNQFGFRSGISTEQMLLFVFDKFLQILDDKKPKFIAVLSLDIKKAFDTVNHQLLIKKLHSLYHFSESSCSLISSYLSNRQQSLKIKQVISPSLPIIKGVPQGSILGPLLFNMTINDMLNSHSNTYAYADDTLTAVISDNQASVLQLATDKFATLNNWYSQNGLTLNISKTKFLILSNRQLKDEPSLIIGNLKLKPEKVIGVLGINIDNKLSLKYHINSITNHANTIIYLLRKIRHLLNYEESKLIYTSIIRPKLEYCSSLFLNLNSSLIQKLESTQNKAIRVLCQAPKQNFSITDARSLLNIPTLQSRRTVLFQNLVKKCLIQTSNQLRSTLYNEPSHNRTLRSACTRILPSVNTQLGKRRFTYQAIQLISQHTINMPLNFNNKGVLS